MIADKKRFSGIRHFKVQKQQNMILEILQFGTKTPTYDIKT